MIKHQRIWYSQFSNKLTKIITLASHKLYCVIAYRAPYRSDNTIKNYIATSLYTYYYKKFTPIPESNKFCKRIQETEWLNLLLLAFTQQKQVHFYSNRESFQNVVERVVTLVKTYWKIVFTSLQLIVWRMYSLHVLVLVMVRRRTK